jgi:hypothetical protein
MTNRDEKKPRNESKLTRSLRANGYLFPTTIEQVNYLEEHHEDLFNNLPSNLTSASDILRRGAMTLESRLQNHTIDEHTQTSLAQAAREGKEISEEVKQQMRKDRLNANGSNHGDSTNSSETRPV